MDIGFSFYLVNSENKCVKILLLRSLLVTLLGYFSFINVLAETNDHQKLYICVSGNGVNIDFTAGI